MKREERDGPRRGLKAKERGESRKKMEEKKGRRRIYGAEVGVARRERGEDKRKERWEKRI